MAYVAEVSRGVNLSTNFFVSLDYCNYLFYKNIVRTRFESLVQKMDELRPKKPKTMNLKRVGWKTGF